MTAKLTELINKQDTREIVRDKIADILVVERENQKGLALADGQDPALWDFAVYRERAFPYPQWQNDGSSLAVPLIVNVWFESGSLVNPASFTREQQSEMGKINIDIYGRGVNEPDGNGGQIPADLAAALNMHRGVRLCRNILMAGAYTYLDLRGLVGQRMPDSFQVFQPPIDDQQTYSAVACRFRLDVRYEEFSPQATPETLEKIVFSTTILPSGAVVPIEFDYTV